MIWGNQALKSVSPRHTVLHCRGGRVGGTFQKGGRFSSTFIHARVFPGTGPQGLIKVWAQLTLRRWPLKPSVLAKKLHRT